MAAPITNAPVTFAPFRAAIVGIKGNPAVAVTAVSAGPFFIILGLHF